MQYWINQEGVQAGPVTREELEKMNITPNTYVWRSGLADWKKIGDVPELADLLTANASHAAVPPELSRRKRWCCTRGAKPLCGTGRV